MAFLQRLEPVRTAEDLDALLIVQHLVDHWWIDVRRAVPLIQRSRADAEDALQQLEDVQIAGVPLIVGVEGSPANEPRPGPSRPQPFPFLADIDERLGAPCREQPTRSSIARSWAEHRERISSSELAGVVGAQPTNLQRVLKDLEADGVLAPGRETRCGAGFFYVPTGGPSARTTGRDGPAR